MKRRLVFYLFASTLALPCLLRSQLPPDSAAAHPNSPQNAERKSSTETVVAHPLDAADLDTFFDGIIPLQLERSDVAGATVLVMKDGKPLLFKGYGYADAKEKIAVDPRLQFSDWRRSQAVYLGFRDATARARQTGSGC